MAQPVWVLSVDLQTKTATFQSGLADAARSARKSFGDISSGAGEMGAGVAKGSIDVRHSLGLVDNVIRGAHAQAMADLIRMYAQSALVMTALPIAATAAGLALIGGIVYEVAEHLEKMKEAQEKITDDQTKFGTAVNESFRGFEDRILSASAKADELRNDHLGALRAQLQVIDNQSMDELIKSLEEVAKASDEVFKDLQAHWYNFGSGSVGAQHALTEFQVQYNNLLSSGKDKDASALLAGTLASAEKIKALQDAARSTKGGDVTDSSYAAQLQLRQQGAGYTDREYEAQIQLVQALQAQVGLEGKVNELKKLDSANTTRETSNTMAAEKSAAARQAAESQLKMGESAVAADRAQADAQLTIHRASIEERLSSDLDFANRELAVQQAGNQAQIAALDKAGKDYTNQLQALQDKALELTAQHETELAELTAKATTEIAARNLQALEQSEREKIDATVEGSAARLAAINAAIKEEDAANLQSTQTYRDLLTQRVNAARQMGQEQVAAEMAAAEASAKVQSQKNAAALELQKSAPSWNTKSFSDRAAIELAAADNEYQIQQASLKQQQMLLASSGNATTKELQTILDKKLALEQQYEEQVKKIQQQAANQEQVQQREAMADMANNYAQGFARILEGHETFVQMMRKATNELTSNLITAAIDSMAHLDDTKLKQAEAAGRWGFNWGAQYGGPAAPVLAPAMAATFFAGVMAFESGTDSVPGVGRGDTVRAMLSPGEGVVPGGVMDGLRQMARHGSMGGSPTYHLHVRPTYHVQTIDGDGMHDVLEKHTDQLQRHFEHSLRRMNK